MDLYQDFFADLADGKTPHIWQADLAADSLCGNRLIRVPTGFGKTLGVISAWLWNRLQQQDNSWPRRLVWCLPMRVLVEQTADEARSVLEKRGLLWDGVGDHKGKIGVHLLMGGADCGKWHLYPEECSVLIGTQDMLLSRAMNRGYASARARWPMEFGLLNYDTLWVMDEVQLMDAGLATSAQLQAFRDYDAEQGRSKRPCYTWWMSATLQQGWLEKSPDTVQLTSNLQTTTIAAQDRTGHLWDDVSKPFCVEQLKDVKALAALVVEKHNSMDRATSAPTLVVLNTVRNAVEVYDVLLKDSSLKLANTEIRLVHSRFRPAERVAWREEFLNKDSCGPGTNRIIVATQVIEAGVDISASLLISELAPWASLVQRFGRCARWGGTAQVVIADLQPKDDKAAAPYAKDELDAAREALSRLADVSPEHLEAFEEDHSVLLPMLYPYNPKHLLLRHELDELFDTTADLSGADIDISRFIRSGDERDVQVFWVDIPDKTHPSVELRPSREALCSVPFIAARTWLCGKGTKLETGKRAWVWDWMDGDWRKAEGRDFYPGQTLLVASECGGYDFNEVTGSGKGWSPESKKRVPPVPSPPVLADEFADAANDNESLSVSAWKTIATHGEEVDVFASRIVEMLVPDLTIVFNLAARWHDVGKSHSAFQCMIVTGDPPIRCDFAKAPKNAWLRSSNRKGFRHELASTLALFAVLLRHNPDHPALLGPWREFLIAAGMVPAVAKVSDIPPTANEEEILALNADQFNLLAFLVCTHHGKVRMAWHSSPADQASAGDILRIRGVQDKDTIPQLQIFTNDGKLSLLPGSILELAPSTAGLNTSTGQGWTERVLSLLGIYGPYTLAWFEAIFRAADQRASALATEDKLLKVEVSL